MHYLLLRMNLKALVSLSLLNFWCCVVFSREMPHCPWLTYPSSPTLSLITSFTLPPPESATSIIFLWCWMYIASETLWNGRCYEIVKCFYHRVLPICLDLDVQHLCYFSVVTGTQLAPRRHHTQTSMRDCVCPCWWAQSFRASATLGSCGQCMERVSVFLLKVWSAALDRTSYTGPQALPQTFWIRIYILSTS